MESQNKKDELGTTSNKSYPKMVINSGITRINQQLLNDSFCDEGNSSPNSQKSKFSDSSNSSEVLFTGFLNNLRNKKKTFKQEPPTHKREEKNQVSVSHNKSSSSVDIESFFNCSGYGGDLSNLEETINESEIERPCNLENTNSFKFENFTFYQSHQSSINFPAEEKFFDNFDDEKNQNKILEELEKEKGEKSDIYCKLNTFTYNVSGQHNMALSEQDLNDEIINNPLEGQTEGTSITQRTFYLQANANNKIEENIEINLLSTPDNASSNDYHNINAIIEYVNLYDDYQHNIKHENVLANSINDINIPLNYCPNDECNKEQFNFLSAKVEKNEEKYLEVKWENTSHNEEVDSKIMIEKGDYSSIPIFTLNFCSYVTYKKFKKIFSLFVNIFSEPINQATIEKLKTFMNHNQVNVMENIIINNQFIYRDRQHIIVLFMSSKEEIYLKIEHQEQKFSIIRRVSKNPTTKQKKLKNILKKLKKLKKLSKLKYTDSFKNMRINIELGKKRPRDQVEEIYLYDNIKS
jgi:hypothetical protein